jgi:nitrite reductase/ring-hydroxylating ferredoxin subunit
MLTNLPISAWTMATLLDAVGGAAAAPAADLMVGAGVVAAVPTAASGLNDWSDTHGAETRVGLVHAAANTTAADRILLARWRRGVVTSGCVTCPWHGSTFRLTDGEIRRGPASTPQPGFQRACWAGRSKSGRAPEPGLRVSAAGAGLLRHDACSRQEFLALRRPGHDYGRIKIDD